MAYNVKYRAEFTDILGVDWKVDIEENDYSGSIINMTPTDDPLKIEYLTPSDELLYDPIKGSTVSLNIECNTNFQYIDLYNEADMTYKMKVYYEGNTLYWQGWVSNDYTEPYDAPPYTVTITALDGLGLLKYIDFKNGSSYYSGREKERTVILNILSKIGYTTFNEFVNLYEDRVNSDTVDCVFDQIYIEQDLFKDEDCYTVFVEILKHYNAIIRQINGVFTIYRPTELVEDTVYGRTVTSSTITGITITPDQYLYRAGENTSDLRDVNGGMLMFKAPVATVNVVQNYNQADSWIKNHSFDINKYSGGDFDNWTIVSPASQFTKISSVTGWENEKNGVGIGYAGAGTPNTSNYIYQTFGTYSTATTDVIEFSFDYRFRNSSTSPITTKIYMRIKDTSNNIWLTKKVNSETELDESGSAAYIITEDIVANPGLGEWNNWKRYKVGITKAGTYDIYIYCTTNINLTLGIRNVVFRATSDKVTGYTYAVTGKFLWWKYTGSTRQYKTEDVEEIVAREYNKTNGVNGEKIELSYELGDIYDTDIDNILDQFEGSLMLASTPTLSKAASNFVADNRSAYASGGVIVTSNANKVIFTSSVAGQNFTGSTSISNVSGNLSGSAATVQANVAATKRKDKITLSGTFGGGLINCSSDTGAVYNADCAFNGSLSATAQAFVLTYKSDFAAQGFTLTYSGADIIVELDSGENLSLSFENYDGDLQGTVSTVTYYAAGQARIDEITLTGTSGTANITCDGVTKLASKETVETYTESWSTRGNTEEANLLEFLIDEIAATKSKGRQFVQLNLMETDADSFFKIVSNLQDPINLSGVNYRLFIPTRGEYNVRDREWTVDLLEIAEKAAPA